MPNADFGCPLRDRSVEHLRSWTIGEFGQEVMLNRPEVIKAHFLGQHDLRDHLLIGVLHDSWIVRFWYLNFIHHAELHANSLLYVGCRCYPRSFCMSGKPV